MRNAMHRNGVHHPELTKTLAREMRMRGMTHREICNALGISLGSADLWTRGVVLSAEQKRDIQVRRDKKVFTPEWRERRSVWMRTHGHHPQKYSTSDLLGRIRMFYAKHRRIPLKREFNALRIYRVRFGSWNNAIRRAGFDPNPVLFAKKFIARDGHPCDSFSEKIIDDWLLSHGIAHQRSVPYCGTRMTADFALPDGRLIEFFGLAGVQRNYDDLVERKRGLCRARGIALVEVYPNDLFPESNLGALLGAGKESNVGTAS